MKRLHYIMFDKLYLHAYLCLDPCVLLSCVVPFLVSVGEWTGENKCICFFLLPATINLQDNIMLLYNEHLSCVIPEVM